MGDGQRGYFDSGLKHTSTQYFPTIFLPMRKYTYQIAKVTLNGGGIYYSAILRWKTFFGLFKHAWALPTIGEIKTHSRGTYSLDDNVDHLSDCFSLIGGLGREKFSNEESAKSHVDAVLLYLKNLEKQHYDSKVKSIEVVYNDTWGGG